MPATDTAPGNATTAEIVAPITQAKWKYAARSALSLTLAYLIPMGMGWSQPSTAATTVMLITATGLASESLQKGVMRVLGTVAGAVIGLTLIALFPQERMIYLLAASITVSLLAYLYNAYQGDSTMIILAAVVSLMVFNGGDAEGAFLYGVDRAFMTAFGVIVYTVVANTLWPVRAVDNTRKLAAAVADNYHRAFSLLVHPIDEAADDNDTQLAALLSSEEEFQTHFASISRYSDSVQAYLAEWNCVVGCYEELQSALLPALAQVTRHGVDFNQYLENYDAVVAQVEDGFQRLDASWRGEAPAKATRVIAIQHRPDSLRDAPHLTVAAVATRAELLEKVQQILTELNSALDSLLFDSGDFVAGRTPRGKPAFIWLDLENVKTAVRMFCTFWLATALWLSFNPPMGFAFVALCAVLVLLVSYTPVTPKLLFILFSLGFLFALPAYVFLLPNMTHWLQLTVFMFSYGFIGFFLFKGPVAIFFLLGLFTLGIQNTMSYNFDVILLIVLNFYMICALLIVTVHFPFTSKPEKLYSGMVRRFFRKTANMLERAGDYRSGPHRITRNDGSALLAKLRAWGTKIDSRYFPANSPQAIARLNQSCDVLQSQVQVLLQRREEFAGNRLVVASRPENTPDLLVELCDTLAAGNAKDTSTRDAAGGTGPADPFTTIEARLMDAREQLNDLRQAQRLEKYQRAELAQFFVYLNLRASILHSIRSCHEAHRELDWRQLAGPRF